MCTVAQEESAAHDLEDLHFTTLCSSSPTRNRPQAHTRLDAQASSTFNTTTHTPCHTACASHGDDGHTTDHTAKEMERSQDDALILIRAALAKVAERIQGMDAKEWAAGQIPAALRTLIELERQVLGYEDRVALTGKDGGPVKTQHIFQPTQEVWDEVVRKRVEFERLRDGDTEEA